MLQFAGIALTVGFFHRIAGMETLQETVDTIVIAMRGANAVNITGAMCRGETAR